MIMKTYVSIVLRTKTQAVTILGCLFVSPFVISSFREGGREEREGGRGEKQKSISKINVGLYVKHESSDQVIKNYTQIVMVTVTWTTACCSISVYMRQTSIPPCFVLGLALRHFVTIPATTASQVLLLVTITS